MLFKHQNSLKLLGFDSIEAISVAHLCRVAPASGLAEYRSPSGLISCPSIILPSPVDLDLRQNTDMPEARSSSHPGCRQPHVASG